MMKFVTIYILCALACAALGQMVNRGNSGERAAIHMNKFRSTCIDNGIWVNYLQERCCKKNCLKRASGQDDLGPFWANRGKKDPQYSDSKLYVDEPHWLLFRRDEGSFDPFFITRGKRHEPLSNTQNIGFKGRRGNRDYKKMILLDKSPFMAARGKKAEEK